MSNYQTVTPIQLGQAALTTAQTTIYTVPSSSRVYLKEIDICNTTGGALTVNVFLVPSGSTAGTTNAVLYGNSIAANTTYQWKGVQILNTSQALIASASASGLTLIASGGQAV